MANALTIKEALSQGYEKCGVPRSEWQCLTNIEDLTEEDLTDGYYLAQKEPNYFSSTKSRFPNYYLKPLPSSMLMTLEGMMKKCMMHCKKLIFQGQRK